MRNLGQGRGIRLTWKNNKDKTELAGDVIREGGHLREGNEWKVSRRKQYADRQ